MKILIIISIIFAAQISAYLAASLQDKVDACVEPKVEQAIVELNNIISATAQGGNWNSEIESQTVALAHEKIDAIVNDAVVCIKQINSPLIVDELINTIVAALNDQINQQFDEALTQCFSSEVFAQGISGIVDCFNKRVQEGADAALSLIKIAEQQYIPTLADKVDDCIRPRVNRAIVQLNELINTTASAGVWNEEVKRTAIGKTRNIINRQIALGVNCVKNIKSRKISYCTIGEIVRLLNSKIYKRVDYAFENCFSNFNIPEIVQCFENQVQLGAEEAINTIREEFF